MEKNIVIERVYEASKMNIWKALTEKDLMKLWYFNLEVFEAKIGFKFEFMGGPEDGIQYKHVCEITELIPESKLTYSWSYEGYEGISFVSFELFDENGKTRLKLIHSGLESFPESNPDFAIHNFEEGWNHILSISLKTFLEK